MRTTPPHRPRHMPKLGVTTPQQIPAPISTASKCICYYCIKNCVGKMGQWTHDRVVTHQGLQCQLLLSITTETGKQHRERQGEHGQLRPAPPTKMGDWHGRGGHRRRAATGAPFTQAITISSILHHSTEPPLPPRPVPRTPPLPLCHHGHHNHPSSSFSTSPSPPPCSQSSTIPQHPCHDHYSHPQPCHHHHFILPIHDHLLSTCVR